MKVSRYAYCSALREGSKPGNVGRRGLESNDALNHATDGAVRAWAIGLKACSKGKKQSEHLSKDHV